MKYIIILLIFASIQINAQEVKSTVGGSYSTANIQVNFTFGEPITQSYLNPTLKVTQGFHQPKITVTGGVIQVNSDIKFQIYPNPTSQQIVIEHSEIQSDFNLKIYNQIGLLIQTIYLESNKSIIKVSTFAQGNYHFIISDKSNKIISQKTITIVK